MSGMNGVNDMFVRITVAAVVLVVFAALVLKRKRCEKFARMETFRGLKASYDELLRRKVAIVPRMPSPKEPGTVYFVVDASQRLLKDPKVPYEGMDYEDAANLFTEKFGKSSVETTTRAKPTKDKVQIVYDPRTDEVTKVKIPRRWSMPPRRLWLKTSKRTVAVALNPPGGTPIREKTLVLVTGADNRVTSATIRG